MRKWRRAAVLLVGLVCVATIGVARDVVRVYSWDYFFADPQAVAVRQAVATAIGAVMASAPGPIRIVSESSGVDSTVMDAARRVDRARVSILPRSVAAVDAVADDGELLALQSGRAYLELLGFDLEWLPQVPGSPAFPWARVRRRLNCASVRGDRWSPLPGVDYTGRLGVLLPPSIEGQVVVVIGDAVALDVEAEGLDGVPLVTRREQLRRGPSSGVPADFWLEHGDPWKAPEAVTRLTIDALPGRERLVSLKLGRRAPRVLARLRAYDDAARARVCAAPLGIDDAFRQSPELVVLPDTPEYFGAGWSVPESASPFGTVRWMKQHGAILIPSSRDGDVTVRLRAGVASVGEIEQAALSLRVNDVYEAGFSPLKGGAQWHEWNVPDTSWLAGTNELLFTVSPPDGRSARGEQGNGLAFQRLELRIQ